MNDRTKLPKWAQHEIRRLESENDHLNREMENLVGTAPSRVEIDPYRRHAQPDARPMFVENHTKIRFHFGDQKYIDVGFRDDALEIRASPDPLQIHPAAANVIAVNIAP